MKLARLFTVIALAVVVASAAAPAQAQSRQAMYNEMVDIFNQLQSLRGNPAAGPLVTQLEARYEELHQALGGADPSSRLAAEASGAPAVGNPPLAGGGLPAPPGCVSNVNSFPSTDTPIALPINTPSITSTLNVSGVDTYLWDVDVDTSITHTWTSDIQLTIQSPQGTIVTLTTNNDAGNDDHYNGTHWDDDADPDGQVPYTTNDGLATDHNYVIGVVATPLVPEEALAAFRGEDPNGNWVMTLGDSVPAFDGGSLDAWSLTLNTLPVAPDEVTTVFNSTDTPIALPINVPSIASTLAVSGLDDFLSDVNVDTSITHTWTSDIQLTIQSPGGTIVTLTTNNDAGNDDHYDGTTWDDDANPGGQVPYTNNDGLASDHNYVIGVVATPLVPEDALGAFASEDPNGDWVMTLGDSVPAFDGGSLDAWSLELTTAMCGVQEADLEAVKSGDDSGEPIVVWTITVTNNGPGDATNVVVTDPLDPCTTYLGDDCGGMNIPPWTWNVGNLPANTSAVCNITVDASGCPPGPLTNTATVVADETDPVPANNDGTGQVEIGNVLTIPTLDRVGLLLLLLAITLGALVILRRRG